MHAGIEALGRFRIDVVALAYDASERGLDVRPGAAKAVVQIKVTEGGVHVVAPHQSDYAPAEPDAFRVAGWAGHRPAGFGKFVDLALVFLGRVGRLGGPGLVASLGVAALSESRRRCRRRREEYGKAQYARLAGISVD